MEFIKEAVVLFVLGIKDCFIGFLSIKNLRNVPVRKREKSRKDNTDNLKTEDSGIMQKIGQCISLNGLAIFLPLILFDNCFVPSFKYLTNLLHTGPWADWVWNNLQPILFYTFDTCWICPMFLLSRILNCFWFQDIANLALEISCGKPKTGSNFCYYWADFLYSVFIQFLFWNQGLVACFFPISLVGNTLWFIHMCLLYSLYAFEYKWMYTGWPLQKRLSCIGNNLPYFIGFGLPMASVTAVANSYISNGCIFALLFPMYIISGINTTPPVGQFSKSLPVFKPSMYFSDMFFAFFLPKVPRM